MHAQLYRAFAALLCTLFTVSVFANATLTHISGQVSILKLDGKTLTAAAGAEVLAGETIVTSGNGFVRMKMTDGGWMVLPPSSQLKIEQYVYKPEKPADDSFIFSMVKGAMRTASGLIGKRGNRDAYAAKTATATIGIRGTQYDMRVCEAGGCSKDMPEGTYVAVKQGAVAMKSEQGATDVKAGQFAAATPKAAPALLPADPGIGFSAADLFKKEEAGVSPFHGFWTGRVTSVFSTSPAVVEIYVKPNGQVSGKSSWNTKQYPPEPFTNPSIKGDTLTYQYRMNSETGIATLMLDGKGKIKAKFDHGAVSLPAELTLQPDIK